MRRQDPENPSKGRLLIFLLGLVMILGTMAGTGATSDPAERASDGKIGAKFGSCPDDMSCEQSPSGDPMPPRLITGHSVYASWQIHDSMIGGAHGSQTPGPPPTGSVSDMTASPNVQRECVTWFNGANLDQRLGRGENEPNLTHYPGDDPLTGSGVSRQDYGFDRDAPDCRPWTTGKSPSSLGLPTDFGSIAGHFESPSFHATYAIAVESDACDPLNEGTGYRYRGHLDFVDPHGIYHEVQELEYTCSPAHQAASTLSQTLLPWTGTDPHNEEGCRILDLPSVTDLGHKCNGTVQDHTTKRMWITPTHEPVFDPATERVYSFALQVDTCAGINIYETDGKDALGAQNGYQDAERLPEGNATAALGFYHELAYHLYNSIGVRDFIGGWPLPDACTDGSSHSLTETARGRVQHGSPPQGPGDERIMRGNSFDFTLSSPDYGKHRTNCRVQYLSWPMNTYPPGPPPMDDHCYTEDHKIARMDLYVYPDVEHPLLSLYEEESNGRTGFLPSD